MNRPFAPAAEQNKQVIFEALERFLTGDVLEIGSGTGQHGVFFAAQNPGLCWQTSDLQPNLEGIRSWIDDAGLDNLPEPIALDVNGVWPDAQYDSIYGANIFHIMNETAVANCMVGCGRCLRPGGFLAIYGPFNYHGEYTSESNARFDQMLRANDPDSGIRDVDWLQQLATAAGLDLAADIAMPANNRSLVWQKRT